MYCTRLLPLRTSLVNTIVQTFHSGQRTKANVEHKDRLHGLKAESLAPDDVLSVPLDGHPRLIQHHPLVVIVKPDAIHVFVAKYYVACRVGGIPGFPDGFVHSIADGKPTVLQNDAFKGTLAQSVPVNFGLAAAVKFGRTFGADIGARVVPLAVVNIDGNVPLAERMQGIPIVSLVNGRIKGTGGG